MNALPVIPTPAARRWAEIRLRVVPGSVFLVTLTLVCYLWNLRVVPSVFEGEVEAVRANVLSGESGVLVHMLISPFDSVTNGQAMAIIDPHIRARDARLNLIEARMRFVNAQQRMPELDFQRNILDLERLRSDLVSQKVDLATAQIELQRAKNEVARLQPLYQQGVLSESEYEFATKTRDSFQAEVRERGLLITQLEPTIARLEVMMADATNIVAMDLLAESLQLEEAQDELGPFTLRAPMDGVVSHIHFTEGEAIPADVPVFSVSATNSTRIVAYLRQPVGVRPERGMPVEVRTRGPVRRVAVARIREVGVQMDVVTRQMRVRGAANWQERGLPVLIDLPSTLSGVVYPGELVDLVLRPHG